jgi:hypothetical protein
MPRRVTRRDHILGRDGLHRLLIDQLSEATAAVSTFSSVSGTRKRTRSVHTKRLGDRYTS